MSMKIHQFQQRAEDLECGHSFRWAGAIESPKGDHVIAMDCAKCISPETARDTLNEFALYVHFLGAKTGAWNPGALRPAMKVMRAF